MRSRQTFAELRFFAAAVLRQGIAVAEVFRDQPQDFAPRVGPHLRHVIEHVEALLNGLALGMVDYDHRARPTDVETQPVRCAERLRALIERIEQLEDGAQGEALQVGFVYGLDGDAFSFSPSSLARELQFVCSHTIHHYAMLLPELRRLDVPLPEHFGVAPETLRHQLRGSHT
jgi:uncharacterized damage-inducible protein DinB